MDSSVLGTALAGGVVLLCVIGIIRKMIKDKKSGKSITCGGDCSKCTTCPSDRLMPEGQVNVRSKG